jgi:hypothetical protein
MVRRIGLAALWFLAAWTAAAMVALTFDLGGWVAPVVATAAAVSIFVLLGRQPAPVGDPTAQQPQLEA